MTEETPENIEASAGLNGAQIKAALEILANVSNGNTPASVAIELLVSVGLGRGKAVEMVNAQSKIEAVTEE